MATTTVTLTAGAAESAPIAITAGNVMISSSLLSTFNKGSVRLLQEKQTSGQYMPIIDFNGPFSQVFQLNSANYKLQLYGVTAADTISNVEINVVT
jgi:hypothetical protein